MRVKQPALSAGLTTFTVSRELFEKLYGHWLSNRVTASDVAALGATVTVFGLLMALNECLMEAVGTDDEAYWVDLFDNAQELLADHAPMDSVVVVPEGTSRWVLLHERGHAFIGRTSLLSATLKGLDADAFFDRAFTISAPKRGFHFLYDYYQPDQRVHELFADLYAWRMADEETRQIMVPSESPYIRELRQELYGLLEDVDLFAIVLRKVGLDPDHLPLRTNPGVRS